MADYLTTDTELTAVADAIREKGGTSAALTWPTGYVDAIGAISGTSDTAHAIYCNVRSNFDMPLAVEAGEEFTVTVTSTAGLSSVSTLFLGTTVSATSHDVGEWSAGKIGWTVGQSKAFTMPDSDVIVQLFS